MKNETTDEKAELLQLREAKSNYQHDLTKLSEALADEKRAIQNLRQDYDMKLRSFNDDANAAISKERASSQKYSKYADDLKIKLGQEQQKNKIVASLEEQIMAQKKMLSETENATKRVERLMKVVESKNKEEETKALYDELTEVEKAYGEQEELNGKLTEELSSLQRKI